MVTMIQLKVFYARVSVVVIKDGKALTCTNTQTGITEAVTDIVSIIVIAPDMRSALDMLYREEYPYVLYIEQRETGKLVIT